MTSLVLFQAVAGVMAILVLVLVFAPVLTGRARGDRRASHDMQVYRDQLREIEIDEARGILSAEEARGTKVEVSRRLLAAADAEAAETEAAMAPRAVSRIVAPALIVASLAGAWSLYSRIGAPGYPDLPLEFRLERIADARANRPDQAAVEAMVAADPTAPAAVQSNAEAQALIDQLAAVLEQRPGEVQGRRLMARSLGSLGRWSEAHQAQAQVIEILGDDVAATDLVEWAELMILAANGYVSPEAEAALGRALQLDASDPLGRYYTGLVLLQDGRPDETYRLWTNLLRESPPDAPWVMPIQAQIAEVAALAGLPPPEVGPGPTRAEIDAAGEMTEEDRAAMIGGMVDQLAERLGTEGGPPEEWARLIRSLGVMGRIRDASEIWDEAQVAYADDPRALAMLEEAAREAELIQ